MNINSVKIRKRWLAAAAAVLLIVILLASGNGEAFEVETAVITEGSIVESIPASGKVRPSVEITISPDVSGEIVEIYFREGDAISKGDTILKIKQDLYLSIVERAEAALGSMKADYHRQAAEARQARLNLKRCETLLRQDAVSNAEYEKAKAEYEIAGEQLKAASCNIRSGEASLKEARENLTKTVVISPMDGIVSKMNVTPGERVVGTSQMAGTEMLRIADFSSMEVVSDVSENDVVRIREGNSAEISVDAYPGLTFKGLVSHVANSSKFIGTGLGQVANFEVRIAILQGAEEDGNGISFRPGMSATVSIVTESRSGILPVPVQSIFSRDGNEMVWKVRDGRKVFATRIKTGIQSLDFAEAVSGLQKGDTIVTGPYSAVTGGLSDGKRVRVRN